ncbi:cytosine permease [Aeribacillus pallidus]|uniref:purine-cytosine permease family protein n=1 Tax=Aeribacillus TaxID=1055323 RepID=UPI0007B478A3|nr:MULTISPECIES: cytosine permease [Aeribacillus]KZM54472.1 sulfonate ABC transporter substrate-binding protein [Aeribacillus pallidus]MDR9797632.1 cytosine permease [Aeribacillus pallidus]MED0652313.1 cytosine permease [Aeribacillus composti]MED4488494.1 cytosine permease [Aeribacillus pallidus]
MKIETRSIEYIPSEERHGRARDLFPVWFGANMHITTLVAGALTVTLGLNLFWSLVAIIVGNLLGALFMASHSAQGPQLGIPQMIQSRAQFGVIGAILPLFLVMFIYFGYFASSGLLGAQTLSSALSIDLNWSILIMNAVCFIIALYGYDLIHKMQKYFSWLSFIIFLIATYIIIFQLPIPENSWALDQFNMSAFLLAVSITSTWQLSYAPYVADYSRYLPINTKTSHTFWYSYCGTVIGSSWMMILGAILTASIPYYLEDSGSNLAKLFGNFSIIMYIVIVLGQLSINVFNLYGAFMSTVTTLEPFYKFRVTPKVRMWFLLCITIIGTALCIWGQGNFLSFFMNFIFFISYFLIPWTSINLVDYYLLRRGLYSVKDIFDVNGCYGKVNWIAIIAFVVAILAEIPFINTTIYVGSFAKAFDGADIAWAVGLVVPAVLYYFPMKRKLHDPIDMTGMNNYMNTP